MFQEYRINCVVVKFYPTYNTTDVLDNMQTPPRFMPIFGYAIDYNDATTPSSTTILSGYDNYKETRFNKPIKIKIWVASAPMMYQSAGSTGYAVKKRQWIASIDYDTKHYGLKFGIFAGGFNQKITWSWRVKYYLSFRGIY